MVHVDIKKVGLIPDGGGWRMHGKGSDHAKKVDRSKKRGTRTGYVYLHSIVDGFSRLAYTEALNDEKGVTAVGFINRAKAFFAVHGIARFTRVVTDNGSCYHSAAFARTLTGTRHQFIRPFRSTTQREGRALQLRSSRRSSSTPATGRQKPNEPPPSRTERRVRRCDTVRDLRVGADTFVEPDWADAIESFIPTTAAGRRGRGDDDRERNLIRSVLRPRPVPRRHVPAKPRTR